MLVKLDFHQQNFAKSSSVTPVLSHLLAGLFQLRLKTSYTWKSIQLSKTSYLRTITMMSIFSIFTSCAVLIGTTASTGGTIVAHEATVSCQPLLLYFPFPAAADLPLKYEDIDTGVDGVTFVQPPSPYLDLTYSAFDVYGSLLPGTLPLTGVETHSIPQGILTSAVEQATSGTPTIKIAPPYKSVTFESFYFGCSLNVPEGEVSRQIFSLGPPPLPPPWFHIQVWFDLTTLFDA